MLSLSKGTVLVTGANGYIATWVVKYLLDHGYSVRGTVRSIVKGEDLREVFREYGDKLQIEIVPDITKVPHLALMASSTRN